MNHGSLFSGIGGFDLAAKWMNWNNVFQVENNPFCKKILQQHYQTSLLYDDIHDFNGHQFTGKIDVISGGFPCQPYSIAGKREGKNDKRHLWPQMFRIIREIKPTWVVGENVRGLVNWSNGMVFKEIQDNLESEGYEVLPFILPASGVNAPHQRYRLWIIAHNNNIKRGLLREWETEITRSGENATNSIGFGQSTINCSPEYIIPINEQIQTPNNTDQKRWDEFINATFTNKQKFLGGRSYDVWDEWTAEPPVCGMDDGVPNRIHRIEALGNAVVPQIVYRIYNTIQLLTHGPRHQP